LPLHTAPVIARSEATWQSSAFDFVAAFLDCRVSLAAKGFFAMTAHLFAQLNLVANQDYGKLNNQYIHTIEKSGYRN